MGGAVRYIAHTARAGRTGRTVYAARTARTAHADCTVHTARAARAGWFVRSAFFTSSLGWRLIKIKSK